MRPNVRPARGFTMVELMIVVGVMGIIASIAIPNYQKLTARSRRTEMLDVVSKFRLYFKNIYDNQGSFSTTSTLAISTPSDVNPPASFPVGQPASWKNSGLGWTDLPFPPEGGVHMRYLYKITASDTVQFQVCGSFASFGPNSIVCGDQGINGNYYYLEVFHGNGTSEVTEFPPAF